MEILEAPDEGHGGDNSAASALDSGSGSGSALDSHSASRSGSKNSARTGAPKFFAPDDPISPIDVVITDLESVEQRARELDAERMRLLSEAHEIARHNGLRRAAGRSDRERHDLSFREMRADIATALRVSERTIERHINDAHRITHDYSDVYTALREGLISLDHARVIADAGTVIGAGTDEETARRRQHYVDRILPIAFHENAARLRPIARRLAEQFSETSLDERHEAAREDRRVWVQDRDDGMADLTAYLPAIDAYAIYDLLTRTAKSLDTKEEERSTDALRTDIFRDRLLDALPKMSKEPVTAARIQVVLPVASLSDVDEAFPESGFAPFPEDHARAAPAPPEHSSPKHSRPAHSPPASRPGHSPPEHSTSEHSPPAVKPPPPYLEGYGPIDESSARKLAAGAHHWERVHVGEESGTILSVDRYRPSEEIRRWIAARDQHCRFPGCRVPAHRCEIDHTIDAAYGGPTSTDNTGLLCKGHHTLKHHSAWRVKQHPNGTFEWRAPSGRTHLDRPASRVTFTDIVDPRTLRDDVTKATAQRIAEHLAKRDARSRNAADGDDNHPF